MPFRKEIDPSAVSLPTDFPMKGNIVFAQTGLTLSSV